MKSFQKWVIPKFLFLLISLPAWGQDATIDLQEVYSILGLEEVWIHHISLSEGHPVLLSNKGPILLSERGTLEAQGLRLFFSSNWADPPKRLIPGQPMTLIGETIFWNLDPQTGRLQKAPPIPVQGYSLNNQGIYHRWGFPEEEESLLFLKPTDQVLQIDSRGVLIKRDRKLQFYKLEGELIRERQTPHASAIDAAYDPETDQWIILDQERHKLSFSSFRQSQNVIPHLFMTAIEECKEDLDYPLAFEIAQIAREKARLYNKAADPGSWTLEWYTQFYNVESEISAILDPPPFYLDPKESSGQWNVSIKKETSSEAVIRGTARLHTLEGNLIPLTISEGSFSLPFSKEIYYILFEMESGKSYWLSLGE